MTRRATAQDVADLAGVSRSAVSLVLNGRGAGNIAADKQALIIAAAQQLNYTPNTVALSLRSRRSATIGVVTDAIATSAFGGQLLEGAADVAVAHGYLLLVIDTQLTMVLGLMLLAGGAVTLVSRLRAHDDDLDGPNGAVL